MLECISVCPVMWFYRSLKMNNGIVQKDVKKAIFSLYQNENILIDMSKRTLIDKSHE